MQERRRSWSVIRAWTSCRVQASFHALSVALEWAATASSATAASTGCTNNAVDSSPWQRTLITDVHCAKELHAPWTTDQREVRLDKLEVVASFCYLGDMVLAAGGCELSTRTRVKTSRNKFKELLTVLSSRHLSFKMWPLVQLLCAECNAPCQ